MLVKISSAPIERMGRRVVLLIGLSAAALGGAKAVEYDEKPNDEIEWPHHPHGQSYNVNPPVCGEQYTRQQCDEMLLEVRCAFFPWDLQCRQRGSP